MQSVGTLAGGVALSSTTCSQGINGYARGSAGEVPAAVRVLQHILGLSDRAAGLTRQLLTFAQAGPQPSADVHDRAGAIHRRAGHADAAREVALDLQTDGTDLTVLADANQLQQALVNLGAEHARRGGQPTPTPKDRR
jgi:C4-dicarboxylate-specific signal transduction histidine kinase